MYFFHGSFYFQGQLQYEIVGDGTALAFFELEMVGVNNSRVARVFVTPNSRLYNDFDTTYSVSTK